MTPWRRRLRRFRLWLTVGVAAVVILGAVLMGVVQLLLPLASRQPERVAAFLSERVHRPVSFDSVQAQWEGGGPVLRLNGVHIAGATVDQPPLVIPRAELIVDFSSWAKKNRSWNEFHLRGLDLHLEHAADGAWSLRGFAANGDAQAGDNPLLMLGALVVSDTRIAIVDPVNDVNLALHADELRLLISGSTHTLLGLVHGNADGAQPVQIVLRWDADSTRGEAYVGSEHADLAQILQGLDYRGASVRQGLGRLHLWAQFDAAQLLSAHASFDFADVAVHSADETLAALPQFGRLKRLSGLARWQREGAGWSLDVAQLQASNEAQPSSRPSFLHLKQAPQDDHAGYTLTSPEVDLSTFARLASLAEPLPAGLRRWLFDAAPAGLVQAVDLQFSGSDSYQVQADLKDIGLKVSGRKPGIDHLDAHVAGDAQALLLQLPDQSATVQMPGVFRKPFAFSRLGGDWVLYRPDTPAWRLESEAFAFEGEGFGGELAGSIDLPDAGGRPSLDLAAGITHADVPAAKLFWPQNNMPPVAIAWLDRALVSGRVTHGRAVVRGDLADWPFRNNEGRFDAVAEIEDLTLDYHPEWPRGEDVSMRAEFLDNGMHVEIGGAHVLGVNANRGVADINDFAHAALDLEVTGEGTGTQLLALLNASPVGKHYAEQLKGVKVGGKGDVGFTLHQPFGHDQGEPELKGSVKLADADLDGSQWKLHFDKANGEVQFSNHGFQAGPLKVGYLGYPADFRLAVGQTVLDPKHDLEAGLSSTLPLSALFADVPALTPLWPYFPGSAAWNVNLAVADGATRLSLQSDLQGTQILLPAPLTKAAEDSLPTRIDVPLPLEGGQLDLAMGDLLRLRARLPDAKQPLGIGIAFGTDPPARVPPEGIAVSGHTAELDLPRWVAVGVGGGDGIGQRSVDIEAAQARIGERAFKDLGLRIDPQPQGMQIVLSGPEVQGKLQIPSGAAMMSQGISAEFERLYWPAPPPNEDEEAPSALSGVAPTAIPPLNEHVADLRLGHGNFGDARMKASSTAQGLRFDEVVTKSPNVEMRANGDWIGSALGSRSDFSIDLSAQN